MLKKLIQLLCLVYVVWGAMMPAFAQDETYTRWEGDTLVVLDKRPDYPEVTVVYEAIVADRPETAARLVIERPSTHASRVALAQQLNRWDAFILASALANDCPAELIKAVMARESGGNPNAVSPTGATGLMQFIRSTATAMGVLNRYNPEQSIMGGGKYIDFLLDRYEGRPNQLELAIAAYNAGPGAVEDAGYRIPPKHETQVFVPNVLRVYAVYLMQAPIAGAERVRPAPGDPLWPEIR